MSVDIDIRRCHRNSNIQMFLAMFGRLRHSCIDLDFTFTRVLIRIDGVSVDVQGYVDGYS